MRINCGEVQFKIGKLLPQSYGIYYHGIIKYPELEGTCKNHLNPTPGPAETYQNIPEGEFWQPLGQEFP